MRLAAISSIFLVAAMSLPGPAQAQSRSRTGEDAAWLCAMRECQGQVIRNVQILRRQSLTEDDFSAQLGQIASALFETARDNRDGRVGRRVALALAGLARFSEDPVQQDTIRWVADAIRRGDDALFDVEDPFSASPS